MAEHFCAYRFELPTGEIVTLYQASNGDFACPICGFLLAGGEAPWWGDSESQPGITIKTKGFYGSFNICPCCDTEYGYEDCGTNASWRDLRQKWLAEIDQTPEILTQLANINVSIEREAEEEAAAVRSALDAGTLDQQDSAGRTPLTRAAIIGRRDLVDELLAAGANVDAQAPDGRTALLWACACGRADVAERLIDADAEPNIADGRGVTPLMEACRRSELRIATRLIAVGAEINARNRWGETALMAAVRNAIGPSNGPGVRGPLDVRVRLIDLLLENGADPSLTGQYGKTPLMLAGDPEITRTLLEHRPDVHQTDNSGSSSLTHAARDDDPDQIRALVSAGIRVDEADPDGETPLMAAVEFGADRAVGTLIELGANVNARNDHGETPLMVAAWHGEVVIARILIKAGAEVNAQADDGETAIMHAISMRSKLNENPTCCAEGSGHLETVRVLIEAGADLSIQDKQGRTALLRARECNLQDFIALLESAT